MAHIAQNGWLGDSVTVRNKFDLKVYSWQEVEETKY